MARAAILTIASALVLSSCGSAGSSPPAQADGCVASTLVAGASVDLGTPWVGSLSLAATPAGDRFLVTWTDEGNASHAAVLDGGSPPTASAPFDVAPGGVAAFDGTSFVVLAGSPTAGLTMQRFGLDGAALGPAVPVVPPGSAGRMIPELPVISAPGGLAFTWWYAPPQSAAVEVHAMLVGPDGAVKEDTVLAVGSFDPYYGPGPFGALALFQGEPTALVGGANPGGSVAVSELPWDGQAASSSNVVATESWPAPIWPLLAAGDRVVFAANDLDRLPRLYAGVPGGAFTAVWSLPPDSITQSADACGRVIDVSENRLPDGAEGQSLLVQPWNGAPGAPLVIGHVAPEPYPGPRVAVVPTPAGFGIAWVDDLRTLRFATPSWQ